MNLNIIMSTNPNLTFNKLVSTYVQYGNLKDHIQIRHQITYVYVCT